MKKVLVFAAAVAAAALLGWLPNRQRDVGKLLPAEVLVLRQEGDLLALDGGESLRGRGRTWEEAVADLVETAPGEAFFGTTAHIVLVEGAAEALPSVLRDPRLRPAARVYLGEGAPEAVEAAPYLKAHPGSVTVQQLQAAWLEEKMVTLPRLEEAEGRYHLLDG